MESETLQTQNDVTPTNDVETIEWYSPLCKITTISKISAGLVMITLPFAGAYVGWNMRVNYESESTVVNSPGIQNPINPTQNIELEDVARLEKIMQNPSTTQNYSPEELARLEQLKKDFDNRLLSEKLKKEIESMLGTTFNSDTPKTTWPYNSEGIKISTDIGWLVYQPSLNSEFLVSAFINYLDADALSAASSPFLSYVTEFGSNIIFTKNCFTPKACGDVGLYKFDKEKNTLSTMKSSEYYIPSETGSELSPDKTKIALNINSNSYSMKGTEFGYIDLVTDTYTTLEKVAATNNIRFSFNELSGEFETKWLSNSQLSTTLYEYKKCDENHGCSSNFTTPEPISTTTKVWDI